LSKTDFSLTPCFRNCHPCQELSTHTGCLARIDNLKTGVAKSAGPGGDVKPAYLAYARAVGFHIDACLPRSPEHKGKVESKLRFVRRHLRLARPFAGRADLQRETDEQLALSDSPRLCPAMGLSLEASWRAEQAWLRPLTVEARSTSPWSAASPACRRGCPTNCTLTGASIATPPAGWCAGWGSSRPSSGDGRRTAAGWGMFAQASWAVYRSAWSRACWSRCAPRVVWSPSWRPGEVRV
jgi:hypothetical protein